MPLWRRLGHDNSCLDTAQADEASPLLVIDDERRDGDADDFPHDGDLPRFARLQPQRKVCREN
ncbi:hypothetical protein BC374_18755 [Ensifer sp. LC13]|nr:hypothetical protein BC374_18755 [Ensifer sp. LC13]OCP14650.1 hypothetical protein BC362_00130 [Ensifer sp. LC14]OCP33239.1 hypothetical protein BC364_17855 [Ensifer sp. LC499]